MAPRPDEQRTPGVPDVVPATRPVGGSIARKPSDPARYPADGGISSKADWAGLDSAHSVAAEIMSALFVWAGLGWLLDRWLGTAPWFLVIGTLIGNAAAVWLMYRRSLRAEQLAIRNGTAQRPLAPSTGPRP